MPVKTTQVGLTLVEIKGFKVCMEETNTILGGFDCDGGDECKSNLAGSAAFVRDVKPGSDVHSILPNQRSPLENKVYHVVNILQLTVSDDCLLTARVERRSGGF